MTIPVKKAEGAFRTISEASAELDVPQHVLRFWETKFTQIKPMKRGGRRRYYRPEDITLLQQIRELLYTKGYTIKGVQRLFKEGGIVQEAQALVDTVVETAKTPTVAQVLAEGPSAVDANVPTIERTVRRLKRLRNRVEEEFNLH